MTTFCCDIKNKKCIYRECEKSSNIDLTCDDSDKKIYYEYWITRTDEKTGKQDKTYIVKVTEKKKIESTLGSNLLCFSRYAT